MRVMPIQVFTGASGAIQMRAAFRRNWKHYLQEALGLAIFMISACIFSALIYAEKGAWHSSLMGGIKDIVMGIAMGLTALFIFYSPFTAPGGSHINPAVTLAFLRLGKMCRYDSLFFIIFQLLGGTLAVYLMHFLMGRILTDPPVNFAVTIPGKPGLIWALFTEFTIAFITMAMVLFTSNNKTMKRYTRLFSAILVCCWVIIAGPVSGFGMNPARSFASAFPSGIWTAFWIYIVAPLAGMLLAAELYAYMKMKKVIAIAFSIFVCTVSFAQVNKVEAIGITVKDMDRSLQFYTRALGFKKISDKQLSGVQVEKINGIFGINTRVARLQLGDEIIELTDYLTTGGRSIPEDQQSNDLFFQHIAIVVSDMEKAYQLLRKFNVEHVSTAPQTLPKSIVGAEGIKAFYFHDPDNHNLELIWFPPAKGQAKWQRSNGKIFLGIDHTAIGVSSSENSHSFYMDLLGIERKGESWNSGTEQEHLNNVEGASLHITGYRAANGPGIEFLQYINPGPGRPYPAESRADDIWHWQTTLIVADAESLYKKLNSAGFRFISKALVESDMNGVHTKSFMVRDPDGHAMLIKQYIIHQQ